MSIRPAARLACILTAIFAAFFAGPAHGAAVRQLIDSAGDGAGHAFLGGRGVTVDSAGAAFVTAAASDAVFRVDPDGTVTHVAAIAVPTGIQADAAGDVWVASAAFLASALYRIAPGGAVTQVISNQGDGTHVLSRATDVAVGPGGDVYVVGAASDNVFRRTPAGVVSQIIDATGDGMGNQLLEPGAVAVDAAGNVYVTGALTRNAFKITPGGTITQIIDATGDGAGHPLDEPVGIAVDAAANVYVAGLASDNVFRVTPGGVITQILDASGGGSGHPLDAPVDLDVDATGALYVAAAGEFGSTTERVFRVAPDGSVQSLLGASGIDSGVPMESPQRLAVAGPGRVLVVNDGSNNAFDVELLCDPGPRAGCRTPTVAGASRLKMKGLPGRLSWVWRKGEATTPAELGDPTTDDSYSLCLYDGGGALVMEASGTAGDVSRGPSWKQTKAGGFKYTDNRALPEGTRTISLAPGPDGKASVVVKGKGPELRVPGLPLALPATAQVQGTHGLCFEALFSAAGVKRNDAKTFAAVSD